MDGGHRIVRHTRCGWHLAFPLAFLAGFDPGDRIAMASPFYQAGPQTRFQPRVAIRTKHSVAFCDRMLAEAGVAATPGVDFDRDRGGRFVRFSYRAPEVDMRGPRFGWRDGGNCCLYRGRTIIRGARIIT